MTYLELSKNVRVRFLTEHFINFEPGNPSIDGSYVAQKRRYDSFQVLILLDVRWGCAAAAAAAALDPITDVVR